MEILENDVDEEVLAGAMISDGQLQLEVGRLALTPGDWKARLAVLGALRARRDRMNCATHLQWFATHMPSLRLGVHGTFPHVDEYASAFCALRDLWISKVNERGHELATTMNAAHFVVFAEPGLGADLLRRARDLHPLDPHYERALVHYLTMIEPSQSGKPLTKR